MKILNQLKKAKCSKFAYSQNVFQFSSKSSNLDSKFSVFNPDYSRHTIVSNQANSIFYVPRVSALQQVKTFTDKVLPKLEGFVEQRLIEDLKQQLTPLEQEELQDSFNLRRYKALEMPKSSNLRDQNDKDLTPPFQQEYDDLFISYDGKGISKLNNKDIGKYIHFPSKQQYKVFPTGFYGDYLKLEYKRTKSINIMVREEALNIQQFLSFRRNEEERAPFLEVIKNKLVGSFLNQSQDFNLFKLMSDNFFYYSLIYQEVSSSILDYLHDPNSYNRNQLKAFLSSADVYDGLINQIVSQFTDKNFALIFLNSKVLRVKTISQILEFFTKNYCAKVQLRNTQLGIYDHRITENDLITFQFFSQIQKNLKKIVVAYNSELLKEELEKINKELLGKVKIAEQYELNMRHKLMFSKDIVPLLDKHVQPKPEMAEFVFEKLIEKPDIETDYSAFEPYYIDDPFDLKNRYTGYRGFNSGIIYFGDSGAGKSVLLGHLQAWAIENGWAVIPVYRATRFTKDPEDNEQHISGLYLQQQLTREILIEMKITNYKLYEKLKVAKDYGRINSAGIKDGEQEPLPILWDEGRKVFTNSWKIYNEDEDASITKNCPEQFKRISDYIPEPKNLLEIINYGIDNPDFATNAFAEVLSVLNQSKQIKTMILIDEYNELFRETEHNSYKFANRHKGKIPPYALATIRLIMSFDGHLMYNGFKAVALSQSRYHRHKVDPSVFNLSMNFSYEVPLLKLNDLRYAVRFYNYCRFSYATHTEHDIMYAYVMTQGNWKELQHYLRYPCANYPRHKHYMERIAVKREMYETNLEIKKHLKMKAREKSLKARIMMEEMRKESSKEDEYV